MHSMNLSSIHNSQPSFAAAACMFPITNLNKDKNKPFTFLSDLSTNASREYHLPSLHNNLLNRNGTWKIWQNLTSSHKSILNRNKTTTCKMIIIENLLETNPIYDNNNNNIPDIY